MIEVLGVKNADKLVPTEDDNKPVDPISENMNALNGKPLKAFIYQDHDAHIAAHVSFMQDPSVAQMIGQNPQANRIMAALQAHIAEHLGFSYRKQVEDKLGAPLPAPNEELPEEIELQLSRAVATATSQLTQQKQKEAAQQEALQKAQDPIMQMKQAELQIKGQEVQRKAQKDQAELQLKTADLQLKAQKQETDKVLDITKLELQEAEQETDKILDITKLEIEERKVELDAENKALKTAVDANKNRR
jgi:hypothetical protein